jgi:multidrug efflux pump subunit AcrA (membrane-fusion protein)
MKRSTTIFVPAAILVVGALAMYGFLGLKPETAKRPPETRAKVVATEVVALQSVPTAVAAFGRVATAQPVMLYAEVSGKLEPGDIPFQPSQSFQKGDLLVKVDDRQARLDLNTAVSDLMTALATVLPEIKVDFPDEYQVWQDYFNSLEFGQRIAPLPETENARIKLFLARFNVYRLFFTVQDLEIRLEKHKFRAPFDGSIVSVDLRVGSAVRNGSLLGRIINLQDMEVAVPVEARDVPWIDRAAPVTFRSTEMAGQWAGRIVRIGSDIDTRTQTVEVYMAIENGGEVSLLNNVFLEAHIPGRAVESAIAVPPKAIYDDRYVYLIVDGKLERREITVARREIERVIVTEGLHNGDTLVTEIMQGVAPGMPARTKVVASESRGQ